MEPISLLCRHEWYKWYGLAIFLTCLKGGGGDFVVSQSGHCTPATVPIPVYWKGKKRPLLVYEYLCNKKTSLGRFHLPVFADELSSLNKGDINTWNSFAIQILRLGQGDAQYVQCCTIYKYYMHSTVCVLYEGWCAVTVLQCMTNWEQIFAQHSASFIFVAL